MKYWKDITLFIGAAVCLFIGATILLTCGMIGREVFLLDECPRQSYDIVGVVVFIGTGFAILAGHRKS